MIMSTAEQNYVNEFMGGAPAEEKVEKRVSQSINLNIKLDDETGAVWRKMVSEPRFKGVNQAGIIHALIRSYLNQEPRVVHPVNQGREIKGEPVWTDD